MKHLTPLFFLFSFVIVSFCVNAQNVLPSSDDQTVTFITRGDLSPANTAYTISRPGVYTLTSAKTASGVPNVSIIANNVMLDLGGNMLTGGTNGIEIAGNNVTVKNGTIFGTSQNGVLVQGTGCRIQNCDINLTATGIALENASQCALEQCRVRNVTQAGVSLLSSYTNYIHDCSVMGVHNTNDVFGFIASDGGSNIFDGCVVKDIGTTGESVVPVYAKIGLKSAIAGGIVFKGSEKDSQIINCDCLSIGQTTTITQAYGIGLLPTFLSTVVDTIETVTNVSYNNAAYSCAWLDTGDKKYLAVGGVGTSRVVIFYFDEVVGELRSVAQSTLAQVPEQRVAVEWLVLGNRYYLAACGQILDKIIILEFDPKKESLRRVASSQFPANQVYSADWLISGNKKYLAAGSYSTSPLVSIMEFNEATEVLRSVTNDYYSGTALDTDVVRLSWLATGTNKFLACTKQNSKELRIYAFDEAAEKLNLFSQNSDADGNIYSSAWMVSGDKKYLVAGGFTGANVAELTLFRFDEGASEPLRTVTVVKNFDADNTIISVAWLVEGDKKYIAACGIDTASTHGINIFEFDEELESLQTVTRHPVGTTQIWAIDWLISGSKKYLASSALGSSSNVRVHEFNGQQINVPERSLLCNNTLNSVHSLRHEITVVGEVANGVGLKTTTTNQYIASNTAYDCDISFDGVSTQYIDSQANARGVDNIDTNLTTLDQIESIYNDQLPTIESQVDSLNYSVFDELESRVDIQLAGCVDIPVRAPGTLSYAGSYCLADTINGSLAITGNDITVSMNEHTINGGQLVISGDRVLISNGRVRNNAAASGVYVTGNNNFLQNIRSIANQTGFELSGCQNNQLTNCSATECTREGFSLNNCSRTFLSECAVQSLVGTGTVAGIKTVNGTSNSISECTVNGVSTSGGDAYGIKGETEKKSIIIENTVNDVSAPAGVAKGISLEQDAWLNSNVSFLWTYSNSNVIRSRTMDCVSVFPNRSYVALGSESPVGTPVQIFRIDEGTEINLCTEHFNGSWTPRAVQWLKYGEIIYLLVGWGNLTGDDVQVFIFDLESEILLPLTTYSFDAAAGNFLYSAKWLTMPDRRIFLLLTGQANSNVQILSFDGKNLSLLAAKNTGITNVFSDWIVLSPEKILIAIASYNLAGTDFFVYEYNVETNTLEDKDDYLISSARGFSVAWLLYNDQYYLAASVNSPGVGNPGLYVFPYNVVSGSLGIPITDLTFTTAYDVDWLVTGTTVYLAAGVYNPTSNTVRIFRFNPTVPSLTQFFSQALPGSSYCLPIKWIDCMQGRSLLATGQYASNSADWRMMTVLGFDLVGSTTTLLQNNIVSNIVGTGIAANPLADYVFENSVYEATTPYEPWKPRQFDPSNTDSIAYS